VPRIAGIYLLYKTLPYSGAMRVAAPPGYDWPHGPQAEDLTDAEKKEIRRLTAALGAAH